MVHLKRIPEEDTGLSWGWGWGRTDCPLVPEVSGELDQSCDKK